MKTIYRIDLFLTEANEPVKLYFNNLDKALEFFDVTLLNAQNVIGLSLYKRISNFKYKFMGGRDGAAS